MTENLTEQFIDYMRRFKKYQDFLSQLNYTWENIEATAEMNCPSEAQTILPTMMATRKGFNELEIKLIENLVSEELKKIALEISSKAQVVVDILVRNLYERTADVGFLATDADIVQFILNSAPQSDHIQSITKRLVEYRDKYTVYDEIVVFDKEGNVRANLDKESSITHSNDPLIAKTLQVDSYVETYRHTDIRPHLSRSLVYSRKIKEPRIGDAIGVLCLCFRFENEMEGIFKSLKKKNDKSIMLLIDHEGRVISSSDEDHIPLGKRVEMVFEDGFQVVEFGGRDYLAKTCPTKGYQGYMGMGWFGHVMMPLDAAFRQARAQTLDMINRDILAGVMSHSDTFCPALGDIARRAELINLALRRVVWNGQVMAAGKKGDLTKLKAILRQISKTGQKTSKVFAESIRNLHETVISSSMDDVRFLARLAIDVMDRNLYERANDCRWWALASELRMILAKGKPNRGDVAKMTEILEYINGLYTVYTRLFVYDMTGTIVAASNLHKDGVEIVGWKLENDYIQNTFQLATTQQYCVSPFEKTDLYGGRHTYVYNAAIRDLYEPERVVGGIGIVFDSEPEFVAMLKDSIPQKDGAYGVFTDRKGIVISSTSQDCPVGSRLDLPKGFFSLQNGDGLSNIVTYKGQYYAVGCTMSFGYREYKNSGDYENDIIAFVFVPLGEVRTITESQTQLNIEGVRQSSSDVVELATFYVCDKRYAVFASEVEESVELGRLTAMPGARVFLEGSISFRNNTSVVPVINLRTTFGIEKKPHGLRTQIVVIRTKDGLLGLLVDDLDSVLEIETNRVEEVPAMIKGDAGYIKNIIRPVQGDDNLTLLMVLDPDLLLFAARARK